MRLPSRFVFACLALLGGCARAPSEKPRLRIVVNTASPFWEPMRVGMARAGEEFGIDADWVVPGEGTVAKQIDAIEALVAQGIEGICVSPIDPVALVPALRRAKERGVEVLTMDSDSPDSGRTAYIGTVNRRAGEEAGRTLVRILGDSGGKVAGFVGYLTAQNAADRLAGFRAGLAGSRVELIAVHADGGDAGKAQSNVEAALAADPDLAALFTIYSYDAPAAARALRSAGRAGKVRVVGFDAEPDTLRFVEEGTIDAVVVQKPYEFGYQSVRLFDAIRRKGREAALAEFAPGGVLDTGIEVVTRETLPAYRERLRRLGIRSS